MTHKESLYRIDDSEFFRCHSLAIDRFMELIQAAHDRGNTCYLGFPEYYCMTNER